MKKESLIAKLIENYTPPNNQEEIGEISDSDILAGRHMYQILKENARISAQERQGALVYFG